jgi:hypothetical protein
MSYVDLKYNLLKNINPTKFKTQSIFAFEIAGVKIKLKYCGKSFFNVQKFLEVYFNHFKSSIYRFHDKYKPKNYFYT